MMQNSRIQWIDWAKTIGIMIVIFCHVPQYNTVEKQLLCSFQMPLFFLLSGYLHKVPSTIKESIVKYWHTLIIPYTLFQFIFYPYWLVQHHIQEGLDITNLYQSLIKPFANCFLGIPIDGITWFIVALLIVKLSTDCIVVHTKHSNAYLFTICIISMIIAYYIWNDNRLNISFAIDSMFNFIPFFLIGYALKKKKQLLNKQASTIESVAISCVLGTALYILNSTSQNCPYGQQRILFYAMGLIGSGLIIYGCKAIATFTKHCPKFVETVSKGCIMVLGLHWMFIGTTNFVLQKLLHLKNEMLYSTPQASILVGLITIAIYFIICFCQKHFRLILGGR